MEKIFLILTTILTIALSNANMAVAQTTVTQRPIEIATYYVGEIYDTIQPKQTHTKRRLWSAARYSARIEHIAKTIDSIGSPIIAVVGVKSEAVVRDLVTTSKMEYCYLYRPLGHHDRAECAILYQADYLTIEQARSSNYTVMLRGVVDTLQMEFALTQYGSKQPTIKYESTRESTNAPTDVDDGEYAE